jgi:hypothetical protein
MAPPMMPSWAGVSATTPSLSEGGDIKAQYASVLYWTVDLIVPVSGLAARTLANPGPSRGPSWRREMAVSIKHFHPGARGAPATGNSFRLVEEPPRRFSRPASGAGELLPPDLPQGRLDRQAQVAGTKSNL